MKDVYENVMNWMYMSHVEKLSCVVGLCEVTFKPRVLKVLLEKR